VGDERLRQLLYSALPADFPPLNTLRPERHNLPLPPTPFLGREAEITSWREMLLQPATRLLTLTGFGGMGKTRAALHLAELCVEAFPEGVWWVELEEARDVNEMNRRITQSLHLAIQPTPTVQEQLARYLRECHLLLALDNIEQVEDAANAVSDLL